VKIGSGVVEWLVEDPVRELLVERRRTSWGPTRLDRSYRKRSSLLLPA
jgi:hypothetical protein